MALGSFARALAPLLGLGLHWKPRAIRVAAACRRGLAQLESPDDSRVSGGGEQVTFALVGGRVGGCGLGPGLSGGGRRGSRMDGRRQPPWADQSTVCLGSDTHSRSAQVGRILRPSQPLRLGGSAAAGAAAANRGSEAAGLARARGGGLTGRL